MLDAASAESIFFLNLKNYDKNHIKSIILSGDAQFSGTKHRHMVVQHVSRAFSSCPLSILHCEVG